MKAFVLSMIFFLGAAPVFADFTMPDSVASASAFSLSGELDQGELVDSCVFRLHIARKKSHLTTAIIKKRSKFAQAAPVISTFTNMTFAQIAESGMWDQPYKGLAARPIGTLKLYARAFVKCNNSSGQEVRRYSSIGVLDFTELKDAPQMSLKKLASHMMSKRDNF